MQLTYNEFVEFLNKNGETEARTTKLFEFGLVNIPADTLIKFKIDGDFISSFVEGQYLYTFSVMWRKLWEQYDGKFDIITNNYLVECIAKNDIKEDYTNIIYSANKEDNNFKIEYELDLKMDFKPIRKKIMTLIKNFTNLFLGEPEKTFRQAGIKDDNGIITEDGATIFITWLLEKNGEAFKSEVVDKLIEKNNK